MAALSATQLGDRGDDGRLAVLTFRSGTTGVASATEWIPTGLSEITSLVGSYVEGTATTGTNFVLNAQGTGVAAGTNPGDLAVETAAAAVVVVTVKGKI